MTGVYKEAFWLFFFMLGLVGSIDVLSELGGQALAKLIKHHVATSGLIAGWGVLVGGLIFGMVAVAGVTPVMGAVLAIGTLVYLSMRLEAPRIHAVLIALVAVVYWYGWGVASLAPVVIGLLGLQLVNHYHGWVTANAWRELFVGVVATTLLWLVAFPAVGLPLATHWHVLVVSIAVTVVAILYDRILWFRRKQTQRLVYGNNHDALTGVRSLNLFRHDYAYFQHLLTEEHGHNLHLAMVDVDHFKQINDTYGHVVGDEALINFARDIEAYFIPMPYYAAVYRTGGEEFSVFMYGIDDQEVHEAIAGYFDRLAALQVIRSHPDHRLTLSIGVTNIARTDEQLKAFVARTDVNLYRAKRTGRNRLVQT